MEEFAKRIAELAEKYGPHAIDVTRAAVRIEVYSTMAGGAMALAIAAGMVFGCRWLWRRECEDSMNGECCRFFAGIVFVLAMIPLSLGAWSFIDPWVWASLSNPDLWIAKKILKL